MQIPIASNAVILTADKYAFLNTSGSHDSGAILCNSIWQAVYLHNNDALRACSSSSPDMDTDYSFCTNYFELR